MMKALYYDRDGRPVSPEQWQQLGRQPGYSRVGYADATRHGQQVTVITFWSGIAGEGPSGPSPAMPDQKVITVTCRPCRTASAYPTRL